MSSVTPGEFLLIGGPLGVGAVLFFVMGRALSGRVLLAVLVLIPIVFFSLLEAMNNGSLRLSFSIWPADRILVLIMIAIAYVGGVFGALFGHLSRRRRR